MSTTAETVSSCVKFASSLKKAVGFAVAVSEGDAIRKEIESGKHFGCSFPEPKKTTRYNSPYTQEQRRNIVSSIHELRRGGEKSRLAAKFLSISYQTYSRWMDEEKMPYDGPCFRGNFK